MTTEVDARAFRVGDEGSLADEGTAGSTRPSAFGPDDYLAADPQRRFVFVADRFPTQCGAGLACPPAEIKTFRRESGLQLASTVQINRQPTTIVVDPSGSFVYVGHIDNRIYAYAIGSDGALVAVPGSPFSSGLPTNFSERPLAIDLTPTGDYLYAVNGASGQVAALTRGANGGLTPAVNSPYPVSAAAGGSFAALTVSPTGNFLFVTSSLGKVTSLRIDHNTGRVTEVESKNTGSDPTWVSNDPSGQLVFVVNTGSNNVSVYRVGSGGQITDVAGSPFSTGTSPKSITVEPNNRFAYVGTAGSREIVIYRLGSDGSLTRLGSRSFPPGQGVNAVLASR